MKKILTFLIIGGMFAFVTVKSVTRKIKTEKATKEVFVKKSETLNTQSSTTNEFTSPASTELNASQIKENDYSSEVQEASFGE